MAVPAVTQIMQAYFQVTPPADAPKTCPVLPTDPPPAPDTLAVALVEGWRGEVLVALEAGDEGAFVLRGAGLDLDRLAGLRVAAFARPFGIDDEIAEAGDFQHEAKSETDQPEQQVHQRLAHQSFER